MSRRRTPRPYIDEYPAIRIADEVRSGRIDARSHAVLVALTDADGTQRRQRVALTATACHYGGVRPWFVCPACRRRCAVLHLVGATLACRLCHGLSYRSKYEAYEPALPGGGTPHSYGENARTRAR